MTREYAAVQLLRHGPLTYEEFRWITCWTEIGECKAVLDRLEKRKIVRRRNISGNTLYHVDPAAVSRVAA